MERLVLPRHFHKICVCVCVCVLCVCVYVCGGLVGGYCAIVDELKLGGHGAHVKQRMAFEKIAQHYHAHEFGRPGLVRHRLPYKPAHIQPAQPPSPAPLIISAAAHRRRTIPGGRNTHAAAPQLPTRRLRASKVTTSSRCVLIELIIYMPQVLSSPQPPATQTYYPRHSRNPTRGYACKISRSPRTATHPPTVMTRLARGPASAAVRHKNHRGGDTTS